MYSAHNEGKFVVTERFIRALNNTIFKHMTSVSKNMYIDKIADKCNNLYHRTIKVKPIDIKTRTYIEYDNKHSVRDPKFKIGNFVRVPKCNIFAKGHTPNWS